MMKSFFCIYSPIILPARLSIIIELQRVHWGPFMPQSSLLKSLTLPCGVQVSNRIFKSAMSEGFAGKTHAPNSLHTRLYERFSQGGSGIVVTGNVMVDGSALGEPGNVVIEDDRHLTLLKTWANSGQSRDSQLWVQLNHPGKQSPRFISKHPVAPSAIALEGPLKAAFRKPRALTLKEIKTLIQKFSISAKWVKAAGFKGIQIHAAHGYLISQFLSPQHNQRTDAYGGSLSHRMRFLVDVFKAVKSAVGKGFPVGVKLNIDDFKEGGFSPEDALIVIQTLSQLGLDLIELSGGSYEKPVMIGGENKEGYFLEVTHKIRKEISVPLVITGGFRSRIKMESVIENNEADMIGLARPLVLNPDLPKALAENRFERIDLPRIHLLLPFLTRKFGPVLGLGAYELALKDLAQNQPVKIKKNGWGLMFRLLWNQGFKALKVRRS